MKNSLFKRAIAAAAAVPLALTQCLTYANAVSTNDVAGTVKVQAEEKSGVTIEDLLYIPADQTVSRWNKNLAHHFASFEGKSGKIDINDYAADIISKAGDYKDVAEYALSLVSDIEYNVKSNLDVVITGKIAEPDFNEVIRNEMNKASKAPKKAPATIVSPEDFFNDKKPSRRDTLSVRELESLDNEQLAAHLHNMQSTNGGKKSTRSMKAASREEMDFSNTDADKLLSGKKGALPN